MAGRYTIPGRDLKFVAGLLVSRHGSIRQASRTIGVSEKTFQKALYSESLMQRPQVELMIDAANCGVLTDDLEWFSKAELMERGLYGKNPVKVYKTVGGIRYRRCGNVNHVGDRWLPLREFHKCSKHGHKSYCKTCASVAQGSEPYMKVGEVFFAAQELVNRIGKAETCRRVGIGFNALQKIVENKKKYVQRKTARRFIAVLAEVRAANEVRHRDSIHTGAHLRGQTEKPIRTTKDYYKPQGDLGTQQRKRYREIHAR